MSPTTRTLAWVALLGMLIGAALGGLLVSRTDHGSGEVVASPSVDSSRVVVVRDSVEKLRLRHQLDSLRAWIAGAPIDSVVHWLPGWRDTVRLHDTERVSVPAVVIRETADSLAQCQHDRDSARGDGRICQERTKAFASALDLCQRPLGGTPAPSSGGTRWTVSAVLQADGDALRPGLGVDWRPFEHLQVGAEP